MTQKCNVIRIHLKTDTKQRDDLVNFCLNDNTNQYVAIGWSCAYDGVSNSINTYEDFYNAVKQWCAKTGHKINTVINKFKDTKENDLFWTRDLEGFYWLCRAKGEATPHYNKDLDIGALVPVEAYKYGTEVPGQIKATFTRANGGTAETIKDRDGSQIVAFSQYMFNKLSRKDFYAIPKIKGGSILDNLPDFDLEELVISYIQIKENYYVRSNSIAQKSTTTKIECEFLSRDKKNPKRAVVQVKGGKTKELYANEYKKYDDEGYVIYLFAPKVHNLNVLKNGIEIKSSELLDFYFEYKSILPDSITKWESLFE